MFYSQSYFASVINYSDFVFPQQYIKMPCNKQMLKKHSQKYCTGQFYSGISQKLYDQKNLRMRRTGAPAKRLYEK